MAIPVTSARTPIVGSKSLVTYDYSSDNTHTQLPMIETNFSQHHTHLSCFHWLIKWLLHKWKEFSDVNLKLLWTVVLQKGYFVDLPGLSQESWDTTYFMDSPHVWPPGIVLGIMTPGYSKTTWDSSWQYWTCVSHLTESTQHISWKACRACWLCAGNKLGYTIKTTVTGLTQRCCWQTKLKAKSLMATVGP